MIEYGCRFTDDDGRLGVIVARDILHVGGTPYDDVARLDLFTRTRRAHQADRDDIPTDAVVVCREGPEGQWTPVQRFGACAECGTVTPLQGDNTTSVHPARRPGVLPVTFTAPVCPGANRYPRDLKPIMWES